MATHRQQEVLGAVNSLERTTHRFMSNNATNTIDEPPYSPNVAPWNRFLLLSVNQGLKTKFVKGRIMCFAIYLQFPNTF